LYKQRDSISPYRRGIPNDIHNENLYSMKSDYLVDSIAGTTPPYN